jgi:hypothetical protein
LSGRDSPEAPLSHDWLDATHVTFGVITLGWVRGDWQIEESRFRGHESDSYRYDIEVGRLDSTSLRVTWNPSPSLSIQGSWADVVNPEIVEPYLDQERWSLSGAYTLPVGDVGWWSTTLAFGNIQTHHYVRIPGKPLLSAHTGTNTRLVGVSFDAWLAETALHPNNRWTLFARYEEVERDDLIPPGHTAASSRVRRLSVGAIRDVRVSDRAVFGVGALLEHHFAPPFLEPAYGGDPPGAMGFVRLKIG